MAEEELSMNDKVEKLGFNKEEFKKDLFALDDKMLDKCTITANFSKENLEKNVYPDLRKFKTKYGVDLPISICGVDLPKLDRKLDNMLWDKEHGDRSP